MIKLSTYHCHTSFCDGKNTAEEMLLAALDKGCSEIGFSGHSPLGDYTYTMTPSGSFDYFNELIRLRDKYKNDIKVYIGIEQDIASALPSLDFDYIIGSVHAVNVGGVEYDVDASADLVRRVVSEHFGGDPYSYCEAYYERVATVYDKTRCDIIGHFDLVTKFIERDPIFSEEHPRYIKARSAALEAIIDTPAVFEVNTGAMSRGYRTAPYPHPSVLEELKKHSKPIVINSDSHRADTVDYLIDEVGDKLCKQGLKVITNMSEILSLSRA